MQTKNTLENLSVALPVRAVLTLLQLAGRAPLLDAERLWLEGIDREVAATLRAGLVTDARPDVAGTERAIAAG